MSDDFSAATQVERLGELRFAATIPDGWQQGRGAFGGLVLGVMTRALETVAAAPEWPLRLLNAEIFAPVTPGPATVDVEVLRRGTGVATLMARLSQGGSLSARATAAFGKRRTADREHVALTPPERPEFESLAPTPIGPPLGPVFARHLEFRTTALPFGGEPRAHAEGWVRLRKAAPRLGAPELVALVDSYWPAAFALETAPRPMTTLGFTLEVCADLTGLTSTEPYYFRSASPSSHDGFSIDARELWDARGRLVALNQQTFVYIK